jgi:hypothetical protein
MALAALLTLVAGLGCVVAVALLMLTLLIGATYSFAGAAGLVLGLDALAALAGAGGVIVGVRTMQESSPVRLLMLALLVLVFLAIFWIRHAIMFGW